MKTYLMTGGTGYFGSRFAVELLKNGNKVIFLTRSKDNISAEERILERILRIDNNIDTSLIKVIEFNIEKDSILPMDIEKIDGIWHFAANLSFRKQDKDKTFSTNINGIKNMIKLASDLKCPIYHISTAYVNGKNPGEVFEKINMNQKLKFNNPYEESKFEVEKILNKWGSQKQNNFVIFRPSILVGGDYISSNFFGYYSVLYSFYKFKKILSTLREKSYLFRTLIPQKEGVLNVPIFWFTSKKVFLNLISVETASRLVFEIFDSNKMIMGKIFHIVNPTPPPMKVIVKYSIKGIGMKFPVINIPSFCVKVFYIVLSKVLFMFKSTKTISKTIDTYKYYMTEYNIYNTNNTEDIIGKEKFKSYFKETSRDFIYSLSKDFVNKMKKRAIWSPHS